MRVPADVDAHEYPGLNSEFYQADPAEVIDQRLWMLVRFMTDTDIEATMESKPDPLTMTRDRVPDLDERTRFAALESTLILHLSTVLPFIQLGKA